MFMNVFPLDANVWGTVAEWFGAGLSGIAIIMVIWQTKETRESEKELFIYQNNIEKLSIVRNTVSELRSSIVTTLFLSNEDGSIYKVNKIIEQLENELSFINNTRIQITSIIGEIQKIRMLTREIVYINDRERYNLDSSTNSTDSTDKKVQVIMEIMEILDSINKMIWEIQKELLK